MDEIMNINEVVEETGVIEEATKINTDLAKGFGLGTLFGAIITGVGTLVGKKIANVVADRRAKKEADDLEALDSVVTIDDDGDYNFTPDED